MAAPQPVEARITIEPAYDAAVSQYVNEAITRNGINPNQIIRLDQFKPENAKYSTPTTLPMGSDERTVAFRDKKFSKNEELGGNAPPRFVEIVTEDISDPMKAVRTRSELCPLIGVREVDSDGQPTVNYYAMRPNGDLHLYDIDNAIKSAGTIGISTLPRSGGTTPIVEGLNPDQVKRIHVTRAAKSTTGTRTPNDKFATLSPKHREEDRTLRTSAHFYFGGSLTMTGGQAELAKQLKEQFEKAKNERFIKEQPPRYINRLIQNGFSSYDPQDLDALNEHARDKNVPEIHDVTVIDYTAINAATGLSILQIEQIEPDQYAALMHFVTTNRPITPAFLDLLKNRANEKIAAIKKIDEIVATAINVDYRTKYLRVNPLIRERLRVAWLQSKGTLDQNVNVVAGLIARTRNEIRNLP